MEAIYSSERSADFHRTARRYIPGLDKVLTNVAKSRLLQTLQFDVECERNMIGFHIRRGIISISELSQRNLGKANLQWEQ
jgi:hypothetical protein